MQGHPALPTISIGRPCNSAWELMEGDDRVRHCTNCDKDVYSSMGLSRAQILEFITRREGVCMRLYRRPDGTIVTGECADLRAAVRPRLVRGGLFNLALWLLGIIGMSVAALGLVAERKGLFTSADHGEIDRVDSNL